MRYTIDGELPYFSNMNDARLRIMSTRIKSRGKFSDYDILGSILDENGNLKGHVLTKDFDTYYFGCMSNRTVFEINDDGTLANDYDTLSTINVEDAKYHLKLKEDLILPFMDMSNLCLAFKVICKQDKCKGYIRILDADMNCIGACFIFNGVAMCYFNGKVHEIEHDGDFGKLRKDFAIDLTQNPIMVTRFVGAL